MTSFFRNYDMDPDEVHDYGLDRVIVFAGFANDATAFDTRRRSESGDYSIVDLDEDEIFGGTPAEDDLDEDAAIEPFDAWLAGRVTLIETAIEELAAKRKQPEVAKPAVERGLKATVRELGVAALRA